MLTFSLPGDTMKKIIAVFLVACLAVPSLLADEQSDAEAAITEAEAVLEEMNSWGFWIGPALATKMEAEKYLEMAKESFDAGKYADALEYAKMALKYTQRAKGLRLWYLLTRSGIYGYTAPMAPM
jgi:hypothetical protein